MKSRKNGPCILGLVCSNDGEEVVSFQELAGCLIAGIFTHPLGLGGWCERENPREEVRAPPDVVVHETIRGLLCAEVFDGIGP